MQSRKPLWTLDELAAQAALALAVDYAGQASGRVREVPDRRTIRYYTTLGLLDRPAEVRGRTALYGTRHLLQLVAIKRLQARGLSLAEVQAQLLGQTDAALRRLAQLPEGAEASPSSSSGPAEEAADRRRSRFWAHPPAEAGGSAGPEAGPEEDGAAPAPKHLTGIPLGEGVTLLVEAARPLDNLDLAALHAAAAPLLKLLEARRLLGPGGSPSFTKGNPP
jgi:DNA-binding transcriptional MerR regulator